MTKSSSLIRRLQALEEAYAAARVRDPSGDGQGQYDRTRKFLSGCLRALARVRREPIDSPPWKYQTSTLYDLEPFTLAQYLVALCVAGHPDAGEARHLLESTGEDGDLHQLADQVIRRVSS